MRYALIVLMLCALPAEAKQHRDPRVKVEFIRKAPNGACPATGRRALPCPGWEAHHIVPLYCGGKDVWTNMVWLTALQHDALHSSMDCRKR
jgi:5-methylcytosine-specific restriction endonuclease McrA